MGWWSLRCRGPGREHGRPGGFEDECAWLAARTAKSVVIELMQTSSTLWPAVWTTEMCRHTTVTSPTEQYPSRGRNSSKKVAELGPLQVNTRNLDRPGGRSQIVVALGLGEQPRTRRRSSDHRQQPRV